MSQVDHHNRTRYAGPTDAMQDALRVQRELVAVIRDSDALLVDRQLVEFLACRAERLIAAATTEAGRRGA